MGQCFSSSRHHDCGAKDQTSRPRLSSTPLPASSSPHPDGGDGDQTSSPGSSSTPLPKQNCISHFSSSSLHHDSGDEDQISRPGSSSTPLSKQNYEVFLSFRGEDTRHSFTDHLYHRLDDKGIVVFRDNEELRVGEKIDQLLEAIKASKISVPIISPNYASSRWCLKELLQIIESNKTGQLVFPIFYKVEPSDVRKQEGVFGENFRLYKEKNNLDEKLVQDLQNAFEVVTSMKGWESNKITDGYEGALVKIVVRRIFNELRKPILSVPDFLVGVEEHIEEIKEKFNGISSNDAKIIVIHGMGGIGKTTLAKVLYNEFSESFECQSFIPNIREASLNYKGMEGLQKQMMSDILVDKSLPEISHVDEGISIIEKRFKEKRLLLLLDDIENKDQLDKLAAKNNWFGPESVVIIATRNKNIVEAPPVNLSYELDELNYDQSCKLFCKHAFGRDASCPRYLETTVGDIVLMTGGLPLAIEVIGSLLHGKGESFWRATKEKLRKMPNSTVHDKLKISYDALDNEQKQIFLDIACLPISEDLYYAFYMWKSCGFYPEEGIEVLVSLSLIKVLDGCRVVMHDQLVYLGSEIVRNESRDEMGKRSRICSYDEAKEVIEGKQDLKVLHLDECDEITMIPDLSAVKALEGLILYKCQSLMKIHPSIGQFSKTLKVLGVSSCYALKELPLEVGKMKELTRLDISKTRIKEIPISDGYMQKLETLYARGCDRLISIPDSIGSLMKLQRLDISSCRSLMKILESIGKLKLLTNLNLSETGVTHLPDSIRGLYNLKMLLIDHTPIKCFPTSFGMLSKLQELDLGGCWELESLSNLPCNLTSLKFNRDSMETLPDISKFTILKHLTYMDLFEKRNRTLNVGKLNQLESLKIVRSEYHSLQVGEVSYSQEEIKVSNPAKEMDMAPENFTLLPELPSSLVELEVIACQTLRTLPSLSYLKNLSRLRLMDCFELMEINGLERAESLTHLEIKSCRKLSRLSDLSNLKMLTVLCLDGCEKLSDVKGMEKLTSLTRLSFSGCNPNIKFPDLSMLRNLKI